MKTEKRTEVYAQQNGTTRLTPKQWRRLKAKDNKAMKREGNRRAEAAEDTE